MTKPQRPQEIIEYCLKPLDLNGHSAATKEVVRRLADAINTLQITPESSGVRSSTFTKAPAIVINEAAHGYEA